MTRFLLQALLIIVVFIAAWRAGGRPERYVATIYLSMLLAGSIHASIGTNPEFINYGRLVGFRFFLDAAALVGVVFVALRYDRWWTLWVSSVQLIAVMPHLLRIWDVPLEPIIYAIMERWPVWIAIGITGLGVFLHHRRQNTAHLHT